ncbi:uncharacterized protein BXZ73DRAFT_80551 [Epithele typhae]|uniref:uncharacterized protein n=1 Tax=Epithele typhae TaxID=378194 RepID=UPI0020077319|nr:uncharacterized protein BXZ73DRAFT_80551 [Epithele typhae]KAH9918542.1 hypothetical protein BXZ73DRAFT_80551 [Epithele typhae]
MWLMLDIGSLPVDRLSEPAFFFGGVRDVQSPIYRPSRLRSGVPATTKEQADRFTLLEIHDITVARDLCLVMLLAQLNTTSDPTERLNIQASLVCTYSSVIMPREWQGSRTGKRSMPLPDPRRTLTLVRGYGFGRARYLSSLLHRGTMSCNRKGETYDELGGVSIGFIALTLEAPARSQRSQWMAHGALAPAAACSRSP